MSKLINVEFDDIPPLVTKNTLRVIRQLRKYTTKPIIVKNIRSFPNPEWRGYLGIRDDTQRAITTYYLAEHTMEPSFVHETLHSILRYEKYPQISIDPKLAQKLPPPLAKGLIKIKTDFASTIDHPEIYRRLKSDFNLDLDLYFKFEVEQKIARFLKKKKKISGSESLFYDQQDILIGLDYFHWDKYTDSLLQRFQKISPNAYKSCLNLNKRISSIGFQTPKDAFYSACNIKSHIVHYGEKNNINPHFTNFWRTFLIVLPK